MNSTPILDTDFWGTTDNTVQLSNRFQTQTVGESIEVTVEVYAGGTNGTPGIRSPYTLTPSNPTAQVNLADNGLAIAGTLTWQGNLITFSGSGVRPGVVRVGLENAIVASL